jgi:radical SAM protein with 4Fe4S-binding SPASM domain
MILSDAINNLSNDPGCIGIIDCDKFRPNSIDFYLLIKDLYRKEYLPEQKIVLFLTKDYYDVDPAGIMLQSVQRILNLVDISNFFVHIVTTNPEIDKEYKWVLEHVSSDPVAINITKIDGRWNKINDHNEKMFLGIDVPRNNLDYQQLSIKHRDLLENSKVFCMLPWVSMYIEPNSKVRPCCESLEPIGDCSQQSLEEIWNAPAIKQLRKDMLAGNRSSACKKCYFFEDNLNKRNSIRQESLKEFGKHIALVDQTDADGGFKNFKLLNLNLKHNNLCNLSCRMCNLTNSTSWHGPAKHIGIINNNDTVIKIAGDKKIDVLSQVHQHLDTCQQILFEGGEPLMIEEFWHMLDILDEKKRYDVKLSYNSNLTQYKLKGRSIFDIWKKFDDIHVGASLDAEGSRGEYLRPGAKWESILDFRAKMIAEAPHVYLEVQPTVTIFNVLHLPDFHRSWVEKGLITPSQWKINFLHYPKYMSVLTLPPELHNTVKEKYCSHIEWLRRYDQFGKAISTFESVIFALENSLPFDAEDFWENTKKLDQYYKVDFLKVFPELQQLSKYIS